MTEINSSPSAFARGWPPSQPQGPGFRKVKRLESAVLFGDGLPPSSPTCSISRACDFRVRQFRSTYVTLTKPSSPYPIWPTHELISIRANTFISISNRNDNAFNVRHNVLPTEGEWKSNAFADETVKQNVGKTKRPWTVSAPEKAVNYTLSRVNGTRQGTWR